MDTSNLKKFAQAARRQLQAQVTTSLKRVLAAESLARRERLEAVLQLEAQIKADGQAQVIERVAYTWFNRFCALRFMDVNGYNRVGVVSPAEGQFQPEILAEAKMGVVDEGMVSEQSRKQIFALLDGTAPSSEPQAEAYRLLVVAVCNSYHRVMPYLFERIDDYTELLMPDDLLSGNSILASTRDSMTPEVCEDVEVIGWLYQFYISEKKDEVFAALKKNKKISPENIPAATQLFTPHWIVRYLVENSLGRLWMLNRPQSRLIDRMDYYIKPEQAETDFLRVSSPEELKICDPACGSGHMLTYAFDLLYAIYEEEGYQPTEIPEKILTQNLYGIEIDQRAGTLAAFALTMKAREKQRRFFRRPVQPNICVLESVRFEDGELKDYLDFVGRDLFTEPLRETLHQFREADNFGSLIRPAVTDVGDVLALLEEKDVEGQLFLYQTHQKVLKVLRQADYLSSKYHVVVANPPYMGGRNMNKRMGAWAKENFPSSKSDLFAMFIQRNLGMACEKGLVAMITMQSWMFLKSYGDLRKWLFSHIHLLQMFHTGPGLFPELGAFNVLTTNFIIKNTPSKIKGLTRFIKANETPDIQDKISVLFKRDLHFLISVESLNKVPEYPLVYWLNESALENFDKLDLVSDVCPPKQGMATGDNSRFVRFWFEVSRENLSTDSKTKLEAFKSNKRWFPYNKGGNYRKWYGNNDCIIAFTPEDYSALKNMGNHCPSEHFYFKEGIVYSLFGFENFGVRYKPSGFVFDVSGSSIFPEVDLEIVLAFLCSNVAFFYLRALAPTVNFQVGDLARLPLPKLEDDDHTKVSQLSKENIQVCKADWDAIDTSWDFGTSPLFKFSKTSLEKASNEYQNFISGQRLLLRDNEEAINRIMISSYCVADQVEPTVNDRDLSLKPKDLSEMIEDFISYSVGCMFGRYSLDQPGLILANQGETLEDYRRIVGEYLVTSKRTPHPPLTTQYSQPDTHYSFLPDADNVIPILDGDWFPDDITERFRQFLRVTFGEEHYEENLKFLENAIGKNIRKYFLRDFYNDHVRRYKKRPIYWLFSSPKGSFNALIYLHRYRTDTVSIILNDYLRDFRTKLTAHKSHLDQLSINESASAADKTKALKEIETLKKTIQELDDYEREVLYPLATQKLEIDLDDGVKANYPKFGKALKTIAGLS